MRSAVVVLATALCVGLASAADPPASPDSKAILEELRRIRELLERMQPPAAPVAAPTPPSPRVTVNLEGAYVLGRADAPVTLVEFTDLECPYCRQFHVAAFEEIKRNFIDTGRVRYASRDLPLELHANAFSAARAARCAGEQGRFWEMRKSLLLNNTALGGAGALAGIGQKVGLDPAALDSCLASDRHDAAIRGDMSAARAAGVNGTPSFVIGLSRADAVEGVVVVGAQPYSTFEARIRELLRRE